jgi:glucose/arabinose dehydrogenase
LTRSAVRILTALVALSATLQVTVSGKSVGAAAPEGSIPSVVGSVPVVGDWNGTGTTKLGVVSGNRFLLSTGAAPGQADIVAALGDPGDVPIVGDWDGNRTTTIGVWRRGVFYLRNSNTTGDGEIAIPFGNPDDIPVVGDWDGNGTTTIGVWRRGVFYLRNSNTPGDADLVVHYGNPDDVPIVGDWDGNKTVTVGVRRGIRFYLRNSNATGDADITADFGDVGDVAVAGDWTGKGSQSIGVRRGGAFYLRNSNTTGAADISQPYGDLTRVRSEREPNLTVTPVVGGLTNAWDVAFTPDGAMFVTERPGRLSVRLPDGLFRQLNADMSDLFVASETGLMGIEVDPNFTANRRIFTCQGKVGPSVQVVAWVVDAGYTQAVRSANPLVGGLPSTTGRHGGCRPRFGPDGYLWIGTGDAITGTNPQNLASLGGKVLRVDPQTGGAAAGNPFVGVAGADPRIYTYGHRNVQGLALRPGAAQMWAVEQGPDRDDELNLLQPGGNYGWDPVPGYNEGVPMTFAGAVPAKWSSGYPTVATSGGTFVSGPAWGRWDGALAVGELKNQLLRIFLLDGDSVVDSRAPGQLIGAFGRIRTPRMGPDGSLYVTTDNGGGTDVVLRVTPS